MMGLMSGWELRRRLASNERLAAIPVVLVSAAADVQEHASRLGVFSWFQKPVDFPALLQTIRGASNACGSTDAIYGEGSIPSGDGPPVSFAIA
jgi:CheY-like chemotaxis protein